MSHFFRFAMTFDNPQAKYGGKHYNIHFNQLEYKVPFQKIHLIRGTHFELFIIQMLISPKVFGVKNVIVHFGNGRASALK